VNFTLLRYDTSSIGNRMPKFPRNVLSSLSIVEMTLHYHEITEFDDAVTYHQVPEERSS